MIGCRGGSADRSRARGYAAGVGSWDVSGVTPVQLREIADEVERRWPGAILVKNPVGNLNVRFVDGADWRDVAWCDLHFGGVELFDLA